MIRKLILKLRGKESKELEGFYNRGKKGIKVIGVNINKLWKEVKEDKRIRNKEDVFIKRYAKVLQHEHLHEAIGCSGSGYPPRGEEVAIRSCTGEAWTLKDEHFYELK